jgi:hypothetical protein
MMDIFKIYFAKPEKPSQLVEDANLILSLFKDKKVLTEFYLRKHFEFRGNRFQKSLEYLKKTEQLILEVLYTQAEKVGEENKKSIPLNSLLFRKWRLVDLDKQKRVD